MDEKVEKIREFAAKKINRCYNGMAVIKKEEWFFPHNLEDFTDELKKAHEYKYEV